MKKLLTVSIITGIILAVIILAKLTGGFNWYRISTASNEPNLHAGAVVFATCLKKPMRGNFIVYKSHAIDSISNQADDIQGNIYVHRVCGLPGDILEMKNGILFVNNNNFDHSFMLKSYYLLSKADFAKTGLREDSLNNQFQNNYLAINDTTIYLNLDDAQARTFRKKIFVQRFVNNDTTGVFTWLDSKKGFSADNFGPLAIPVGCYFVLGDNRHNALDSRYSGFVTENNCKGVVVGK